MLTTGKDNTWFKTVLRVLSNQELRKNRIGLVVEAWIALFDERTSLTHPKLIFIQLT